MMHRSLVTLLAFLFLAAGNFACTEGTTPDCAVVACGPNLDGSSAAETGGGDASLDVSGDVADAADGADAGDAGDADVLTDAPPG